MSILVAWDNSWLPRPQCSQSGTCLFQSEDGTTPHPPVLTPEGCVTFKVKPGKSSPEKQTTNSCIRNEPPLSYHYSPYALSQWYLGILRCTVWKL